MEIFDYLSQFEEAVPDWLANNAFNPERFFASRTVVYPGAGSDGHAIEIFNRSHSAHCFVYIDQDYSTNQIRQELAPQSYEEGTFYIRGYHVISEQGFSQGTQPADSCSAFHLCVYERNSEYDDCWGARRIAMLLVGAEAHGAYRWLYGGIFAKNPPFGVLLQDHGFGGNCSGDRFDNPLSPMVATARTNGWPRFLVVGEGTKPWPGFVRIAGVKPSVGGMQRNIRVLHELSRHHRRKRYP